MYKIEYQRVGSHMTEIILPYYIYDIYPGFTNRNGHPREGETSWPVRLAF